MVLRCTAFHESPARLAEIAISPYNRNVSVASIPERIGSYQIVRALGKGGMGAVYLAQDAAIERLVAIKLLREGVDSPEIRERFAREARSAGRLRHPNIVTIFHVGEDDSQPYIVMEYIPGDTLADIVKQRMPLSIARKLRIIEEVCRGLSHAHKSGIVHRDVKPANVLVDSEGSVKILDFGIARIDEQEMTRLGMMMGTPHYMSPEQVSPGTADHRSDVFSVGLVMYELLTYKRAFPGDMFAVLHAIVNNEPEPIETLVPDIAPELVAIVQRALQKKPELRYQDIGVMRTELSRLRQRLYASDESGDEGPISIATPPSGAAMDTSASPALPGTSIAQHLNLAKQAFDAQDFERALQECDLTLSLDPENRTAINLRNRAKQEIDATAARSLMAAARAALTDGRLSVAIESVGRVDALRLTGETGIRIGEELNGIRRAIEQARQKIERMRALVEAARGHLREGDPELARQVLDEADAPDDSAMRVLRGEVAAALALREQQAAQARASRWDQRTDETIVITPDATVLQPRAEPPAPEPPLEFSAPEIASPEPVHIAPPPIEPPPDVGPSMPEAADPLDLSLLVKRPVTPAAPVTPPPAPQVTPPPISARETTSRPTPSREITPPPVPYRPSPPPPARPSPQKQGMPTWAIPAGIAAAILVLALSGWMLMPGSSDEGTQAQLTTSAPPTVLPTTSAPATSTVPATTSQPSTTTMQPTTTVRATTTAPVRATSSVPAQARGTVVVPQGRGTVVPPTSVAPTTIAVTTSVAPTTSTIPATTTAPRATGPTPEQDRAAIQTVMNRYVQGVRSMSMDAIRQVFPSSPAFNFRDARAIEMELSNVQISIDGNRATVTCNRYLRQTTTAGRPQESRQNVAFVLERSGSGWLIASVRAA